MRVCDGKDEDIFFEIAVHDAEGELMKNVSAAERNIRSGASAMAEIARWNSFSKSSAAVWLRYTKRVKKDTPDASG